MRDKKAILINTDGKVKELGLNPPYRDLVSPKKLTLEQLQKLVGGYIEVIRQVPYEGRLATMIVDEEGLLKNKPVNFTATHLYRCTKFGAPSIFGDVVLLLGWRM